MPIYKLPGGSVKQDKIQIPFGLNANNDLVHISEAEKGGSYKCLSCSTVLTAIKGQKYAHHFRHYTIVNCNGESIIHKAAKKIILEKMQITSPNGECIHFDSASEEARLDEMKPDVLALIGNSQLIIEIYYTHKVDDDKKEKIKKANISAIEIELSDLSLEDVKNKDSFWLYINDPNHIAWLHEATPPNKVTPFTPGKLMQFKEAWEILQACKMNKAHRPIHTIANTQNMPWDIRKLLQQPIARRRSKKRF